MHWKLLLFYILKFLRQVEVSIGCFFSILGFFALLLLNKWHACYKTSKKYKIVLESTLSYYNIKHKNSHIYLSVLKQPVEPCVTPFLFIRKHFSITAGLKKPKSYSWQAFRSLCQDRFWDCFIFFFFYI